MNKQEQEIINKGYKREYLTNLDKLRIIRTYMQGSIIAVFANRLNPLLYLVLILELITGFFVALFSDQNYLDSIKTVINALLGRELLSEFKVWTL
jgi:intracellular septation protein A